MVLEKPLMIIPVRDKLLMGGGFETPINGVPPTGLI
jgi:hypothetical protein